MKLAQVFKDGRLVLVSQPTLNFFICLLIQFLWSYLDDFQFLTINTLISYQVPGVGQMIQYVLLNIIQVDILQTEKWLS